MVRVVSVHSFRGGTGKSNITANVAVQLAQRGLRVGVIDTAVLLTAYADTDAAISAINDVGLDHYIVKPWDPPQERLYPVLDEVLEEWQATRPRPEAGLRVIGERWSAASHRLRDYLARNQVPFRWLDVDHHDAGPLLVAAGSDVRLPALLLEDGAVLSDPSPVEVATRLGLAARPGVDYCDLVVIGGGPAGLAAAVYGASEGLSTAVVEAEAPGGQAALSSRIENYLGFPSGISGSELARRALAQARRFGATVVAPHRATGIRIEDPYRVITLDDGSELHCASIVLATGVQYRRLDLPGIDALTGAGVYYGAASTEAAGMAGARVIVVGGANSAGQAALHLATVADEVVLVLRGPSLSARMSTYLTQRIVATETITVRVGTEVTAVGGSGRLQTADLRRADGGDETLDVAGMFVFIGARPRTAWLGDAVVTDAHGFIPTGPQVQHRWPLARDPFLLETSQPAVFAVGDVRAESIKRVASAVGEGSVAVQFVHQILRGL